MIGSALDIIHTHITLSSTMYHTQNPHQRELNHSSLGQTCRTVILQSGDYGHAGSWVIWKCVGASGIADIPTIGRITEIFQVLGSSEQRHGLASFCTIQRAITGEWHSVYGMRQIELAEEFILVKPEV